MQTTTTGAGAPNSAVGASAAQATGNTAAAAQGVNNTTATTLQNATTATNVAAATSSNVNVNSASVGVTNVGGGSGGEGGVGLAGGVSAEMDAQQRKELRNLIVAIKSKNSNQQLHGLTQLKILSSADAKNKVIIREEGTIGPTVLLLASENVKIQLAAVRLLRSLSVNEENQQAIADENGIPPLINLLESPFAKLQLNAAATLWNLSVNDDNKRKIAKEGAIRPLIFLLDSNNIKVQNEACGALRNLSFNDKNQRLIGKDGGITLLLDLLKSDDENLKRNSAITLNNLTSANEENKRRLRKEGGVELLISVLLANDINVLGFDPEKELQKRPRPDGFKGNATVTGNGSEDSSVSLTTEVFDTVVWNDIKIEKKIGSGAYGDVYKARYHGYPIAVKIIKESLSAEEAKREKILEEIKIMSMLKHVNIVSLIGCTLSPDHQVAIVTEFAGRGNLKDSLKDIKSLPQRLKLAKDIVAGLNWMHANNIIHRDLKLANLLVTDDLQIKITDFGLSLHWYEGIVCHHFKGNVKYSSPEILRARADKNITIYSYCPQTDVYSFGLMLWELVTVMPLFPGVKGKQNITQHVLAGNRPEIYEEWPKSLKTLLALCWHEDPNRRPLFREIQDKFDRVIIDVMCFGRDTPVLMADGRFKMVQDLVVGDVVLGDDGRTPRKVTRTTHGVDRMARVELVGERDSSFVCNMSHLLSCKLSSHASLRMRNGNAFVSMAVTDADANRVIVDGEHDNIVTSIKMVERQVESWRVAHTIVVALGGDVSVPQRTAKKITGFVQPFRTLSDAVRAVSDLLGLRFSAEQVEAVCKRSTTRLAFGAVQVAAIKAAVMRKLSLGGLPTFFDESVDVAVRHVLDSGRVSPAARKALLAYHAPIKSTEAVGRAAMKITKVEQGEFFGFTVGGNGRVIVGETHIVSHQCPDPTGRRICKKLWKGCELKKVTYEEFEEAFLEKTRLNLKLIRHIHLKCFDEEHSQVLTNEGFLFLDELLAHVEWRAANAAQDGTTVRVTDWRGLRVASYDARSGQLVYKQPNELVVNAPGGDIVQFATTPLDAAPTFAHAAPHGAAGVDIVATRNHELYVRAGADLDGARRLGEYEKLTCEELLSSRRAVDAVRFLGAAFNGVTTSAEPVSHEQLTHKRGVAASADGEDKTFDLTPFKSRIVDMSAEPVRVFSAVYADSDKRAPRAATTAVVPTPFAALCLSGGAQSAAFLELYGMWLADGGVLDGARVVLASRLARVEALLQACGLVCGVDFVGERAAVLSVHKASWSAVFAREHAVTGGKSLGSWALAHLDQQAARRLIVGLCNGADEIRTPSVLLRDDAVRLCLHAGYSATFALGGAAQWCVRFTDADAVAEPRVQITGAHADVVDQRTTSGRTWCVDVSSVDARTGTPLNDGFVVVRRAQRVSAAAYARLLEQSSAVAPLVAAAAKLQVRHDAAVADKATLAAELAAAQAAVRDATRDAERLVNASASQRGNDERWVVVKASRPTIQGNCLCAVICDNFDDTITLERFCNAVNWFGPMYPVEKFLERIRDLLQKKWFHGFVNSNKAAQLLKTRWSSTKQQYYLYRFSLSTPGCFALTFIEEDGTIVHKRISHSFNSSFVLMNNSPPLDFPTIDLLHNGCLQDPNLLRAKKILPGSPFSSLFE